MERDLGCNDCGLLRVLWSLNCIILWCAGESEDSEWDEAFIDELATARQLLWLLFCSYYLHVCYLHSPYSIHSSIARSILNFCWRHWECWSYLMEHFPKPSTNAHHAVWISEIFLLKHPFSSYSSWTTWILTAWFHKGSTYSVGM